ncbi:MAG: hypothetical protein WBG37_19830 [Desulfobacterales bacterium]
MRANEAVFGKAIASPPRELVALPARKVGGIIDQARAGPLSSS